MITTAWVRGAGLNEDSAKCYPASSCEHHDGSNNGMALVITCAQEHAEFYCETLKTHGLLSTIEPDE